MGEYWLRHSNSYFTVLGFNLFVRHKPIAEVLLRKAQSNIYDIISQEFQKKEINLQKVLHRICIFLTFV